MPKRRGRPNAFSGRRAQKLVSLVRKYGLSGTVNYLSTNQVQFKSNEPAENVKISLPTLAKLAKNAGLSLQRGRPPMKKAA